MDDPTSVTVGERHQEWTDDLGDDERFEITQDGANFRKEGLWLGAFEDKVEVRVRFEGNVEFEDMFVIQGGLNQRFTRDVGQNDTATARMRNNLGGGRKKLEVEKKGGGNKRKKVRFFPPPTSSSTLVWFGRDRGTIESRGARVP